MQTVNIHDARTHLSRLVDAAANGEEIAIIKVGKAGKPVARLLPIHGDRAPRRFGWFERKGENG
jgi:prevent-host-death family protein